MKVESESAFSSEVETRAADSFFDISGKQSWF